MGPVGSEGESMSGYGMKDKTWNDLVSLAELVNDMRTTQKMFQESGDIRLVNVVIFYERKVDKAVFNILMRDYCIDNNPLLNEEVNDEQTTAESN